MGIEVQIAGKVILNVIGMSIRSSLSTISNEFTLLISSGKNSIEIESNLDYKPGEAAAIQIDGTSVINGFIDTIRVSYGPGKHRIELSGRDRTADFIDSSVVETNIEGSIQFEKLLRTVLDGMGLQSIGITNLMPASADLLIRENKNISSEIGQTGFEFIDQFARLKQVLLKGDGAGNIQMTRGGGDFTIKTALVNIPGQKENNIIRGEFIQSNVNRFNTYTVRSQEDFSALNFDLDVGNSVGNSGIATDSKIRTSRNIVFEAEENSTSKECADRATWESDIARAKGTKFAAVVIGYSVITTDALGTLRVLWQPNATVPIVDVFSNIRSIMLIESVHYQLSRSLGSITEIILVPPDSYTILAERDASEARINLIGKEDAF